MSPEFAILIVDDDTDLASNLQYILEAEGYRTAVAKDGQTALTLCREKIFDLTLVDIKLPDISGAKLIQNLAKLLPTMEYIINTGYASLETAVEFVGQRHIVAYETKPLNMTRLLSLITQVVERRRMEKRLVEYEELNKLKTGLLSTVSHELRTPLATIKGYSTMLLDYNRRLGHEEKSDCLQSIDRATDRLTELVDHLLDMSRLDAGLLKIERVPTNISKLIKEAVAEAQLRASRHNMVAYVTKRPQTVIIDAKRIRQVLDNLLDNATKYSEEGTEVVVSTRQNGKELLINITDQGIGITSKDLEKVFDRMYRIEQRLTPEIGGIGLGLAICKGLVEAHNGRIWVESKVGKGSNFCFTIPLETPIEENSRDEKVAEKGSSHHRG